MAETIIYNKDLNTDYRNVLSHINDFTKGLGVSLCHVDEDTLYSGVLQSMRMDFPYVNGLDNANVFKKAGYFMAHFIALQPVRSAFPRAAIGPLADMSNHQNAIIALNIAIESLYGATVISENRETPLSNRIKVSKHSYIDIIDAIRQQVSISGHSKVFAVLLEQLAYKCNPECQDDLIEL